MDVKNRVEQVCEPLKNVSEFAYEYCIDRGLDFAKVVAKQTLEDLIFEESNPVVLKEVDKILMEENGDIWTPELLAEEHTIVVSKAYQDLGELYVGNVDEINEVIDYILEPAVLRSLDVLETIKQSAKKTDMFDEIGVFQKNVLNYISNYFYHKVVEEYSNPYNHQF